MLTDHLHEGTILFAENISDWRTAIEAVASPLLHNGAITQQYVDAMCDSIAAGGTYIDLGHGIALAHARPEAGVVRTALSALRVRPAVLLNDDSDHPIDLFVCLAASDSQGHLAALADLGRLLSNPSARESLLAATDTAEFMASLESGDHQ